MKRTIVNCDRCSKEISGYGYHNHLKFTLRYWHGGSIGGSEDDENFDMDLCGDCAQELSYNIKKWLKKEK